MIKMEQLKSKSSDLRMWMPGSELSIRRINLHFLLCCMGSLHALHVTMTTNYSIVTQISTLW